MNVHAALANADTPETGQHRDRDEDVEDHFRKKGFVFEDEDGDHDARLSRWLSLGVLVFLFAVAARVAMLLWVLAFSGEEGKPKKKVLFEGMPTRQEIGLVLEGIWSRVEGSIVHGVRGGLEDMGGIGTTAVVNGVGSGGVR